jgi:hypothetical protein
VLSLISPKGEIIIRSKSAKSTQVKMANHWYKITGVSGALAVALGAAGAHMLLKKEDHMKDIWKVRNACCYAVVRDKERLY